MKKPLVLLTLLTILLVACQKQTAIPILVGNHYELDLSYLSQKELNKLGGNTLQQIPSEGLFSVPKLRQMRDEMIKSNELKSINPDLLIESSFIYLVTSTNQDVSDYLSKSRYSYLEFIPTKYTYIVFVPLSRLSDFLETFAKMDSVTSVKESGYQTTLEWND